MSERRPAVFFDRDGVLNRAFVRDGRPYPPRNLQKLELTPNARVACDTLRAAGFVLIVVTNQPEVARGTQSMEVVEEMNLWLQNALRLDACLVCPHDDVDHCDCRKPEPGLLTRAAEQYQIDLSASFMIGDRWRDVDAGLKAGCKTIFLDYEYREQRPKKPDYTCVNLLDAVEWILYVSNIQLENSELENGPHEYALRTEN